MASDEELEVIKLLTEDVQSHRDYVQRLYRNAVLIGGSVLLLIAVLGTWLLGERYDESLLRTVVNNELRGEVDRLREEQTKLLEQELSTSMQSATEDAQESIISAADESKAQAISELNEFAEEQLFEAVRQNIEPQIEELQATTAVELAGAIAFPSGLVAAFDLPEGCPLGWSRYQPAASRVIIGASTIAELDNGPSKLRVGSNGDQLNARPLGSHGGTEQVRLTLQQMPRHTHTVTSSPPDRNIHDAFGGSTANYGLNPVYDPNVQAIPGWSQTQHEEFMSYEGGNEPHYNMPPYIALYYCKKE